jgi:hypothetical protein
MRYLGKVNKRMRQETVPTFYLQQCSIGRWRSDRQPVELAGVSAVIRHAVLLAEEISFSPSPGLGRPSWISVTDTDGNLLFVVPIRLRKRLPLPDLAQPAG